MSSAQAVSSSDFGLLEKTLVCVFVFAWTHHPGGGRNVVRMYHKFFRREQVCGLLLCSRTSNYISMSVTFARRKVQALFGEKFGRKGARTGLSSPVVAVLDAAESVLDAVVSPSLLVPVQ